MLKGLLVKHLPRVIHDISSHTARVQEMCRLTDADKMPRRGVLLTWNGRWLSERTSNTQLYPPGLQLPDLLSRLAAEPGLERLCQKFACFLEQKVKQYRVQFWSWSLEASLEAEQQGRVHIHAYISFKEPSFAGAPFQWVFDGACPHFASTMSRGSRRVSFAIQQAHFYCQVRKKGQLRSFTNWPAYTHFKVKVEWVTGLWQMRKLEYNDYKEELLRTRGSVKRHLEEAEWQLNQAAQEVMIREAAMMARTFNIHRCSWRDLQPVTLWKQQYCTAADGGPSVPLQRFKFLVLAGPSRTGKSNFAREVMPPCLYLNCQGCTEPLLKEFRVSHHRSICYDELDWRVIVANKLIFQAQNEPIQLAQSKCQLHTYTVRLYGVGMIVCTNKWLHGQTDQDEEDVAWLAANSILLDVQHPLWVEP